MLYHCMIERSLGKKFGVWLTSIAPFQYIHFSFEWFASFDYQQLVSYTGKEKKTNNLGFLQFSSLCVCMLGCALFVLSFFVIHNSFNQRKLIIGGPATCWNNHFLKLAFHLLSDISSSGHFYNFQFSIRGSCGSLYIK